MTARILMGLSLMLSVSAGASAEPAGDCSNAGSEPAIVTCKQKSLAALDDQLLKQIQTLRSRYQSAEPIRVTLLQRSQEVWSMYRDSECKLLTSANAAAPGFQARQLDCFAAMTQRRSAELQALIDAK